MSTSTPELLAAQLSRAPAPSEADFAEIVRAYRASSDAARFVRTLHQQPAAAEGDERRSGGEPSPDRPLKAIAETLLLHHDLLVGRRSAQAVAPVQAIRQAYRHYIVNTQGPIPLEPSVDAFDVLAWASEYAQMFGIALRPVERPGGPLAMVIDDPHDPVFVDRWRADGRSSAAALRDLGRQINYRRYGRDDVIPSRLFAFDAAAPHTHRFGNAMWLADMSQLVYLREGYVKDELGRWGYGDVVWIEDQGTDTQAMVTARDDHVVVAFRGTRGGTDILTDLKFGKKPFVAGPDRAPPVGQVHRGFLAALDSVWGKVLAAVQDTAHGRPVFVCGHSLGAALAQLAARRLVGHGQAVAAVYVYGSPRVGNDDFRDDYNRALQDRTFLHINNDDAVTRVPPPWLGFRHVARTDRRFGADHKISIGDSDSGSRANPPQGERAALEEQLSREAEDALNQSRRYLQKTARPVANLYGATFESGAIDDHGVGEYLFKFACAIVEERFKTLD